MARLQNRQELMNEIRTTLVQICKRAVSEGFVARVEGLIGITLENDSVFLINIQENFIDSKQDHAADQRPVNDTSSDEHHVEDHRMEVSRKFQLDGAAVMPGLNTNADQGSKSQKEVSKLDMLMRYSNSLFDQFMTDPCNKQQKMIVNYASSIEQRAFNSKQPQQSLACLSDDKHKETTPAKEFRQRAASGEAELPFSDQSFSIKEEPSSQASFEDSMNCNEMSVGKARTWSGPSANLDSISKSSSATQCQKDPQKDDDFEDVVSLPDRKPTEFPGYEFLPQPWMGNSFEAFGTPGEFGENPESRPYVCELCDASFSKKFCLANHIVTIHQVGGKYVCKHCGKQFLQKLRYLTHVDRHNNIRRHICQLCGKAFSYKYSLWSHAKKCLGNVPGLGEAPFPALPEPAFPALPEPEFPNQGVNDGAAAEEEESEA